VSKPGALMVEKRVYAVLISGTKVDSTNWPWFQIGSWSYRCDL